jgi:hypothetical protein
MVRRGRGPVLWSSSKLGDALEEELVGAHREAIMVFVNSGVTQRGSAIPPWLMSNQSRNVGTLLLD